MRQTLFGLASVVVLFGIDRALASIAIEINAAGALLSPSGAASLEAFGVALAFLLTRLSLAFVFCLTAAMLSWSGVQWAFGPPEGRAPEG